MKLACSFCGADPSLLHDCHGLARFNEEQDKLVRAAFMDRARSDHPILANASTIRGYNIDALRWALEAEESETVDCESTSRANAALVAVRGPAKLAAIIAELLQRRGIATAAEGYENSFVLVSGIENPQFATVWIRSGRLSKTVFDCDLSMPQARAFALVLLDAPRASAQDIEHMIEEVTR